MTVWIWIKKCWVGVTSVAGDLAIIAGIFVFTDRFATTKDIAITKQLFAKDFEKMEIKVASAIDTLNKSVQLQFNANRYKILSDQISQLKLLLRKTPEDKELKDEYKRVVEERENVIKSLQLKLK